MLALLGELDGAPDVDDPVERFVGVRTAVAGRSRQLVAGAIGCQVGAETWSSCCSAAASV